MPSAPPTLLRRMFDAAVEYAAPRQCVPPHLPAPPPGRTIVVGAGKAAAAMARAVESCYPAPLEGLVVTRYGHGVPCQRIQVVEAAHPVPDATGRAAAQRILELVSGLTPDDLVLCLLSGGGSALLALPRPWVSFEDKQAITRQLLRAGAPIGDINCVRKHLSAVKGGALGVACHPARLLTLAISDVPGDDPSTIASGPTVADTTTSAQALAVCERYRIELPAAVREGLAGCETPRPDAPGLAGSELVVIATATGALDAATAVARDHGVEVLRLGDALEGEARTLAAEHAALARRIAAGHEPCERPCILLSGGETTVTVRGRGRGGRNSEYALSLALALEAAPDIWALACDTDGIDGTETNAGCVVTPDTLARCADCGLDPAAMLADNDAYALFAALGDLVVTGPTHTNVNDFRAIYVGR